MNNVKPGQRAICSMPGLLMGSVVDVEQEAHANEPLPGNSMFFSIVPAHLVVWWCSLDRPVWVEGTEFTILPIPDKYLHPVSGLDVGGSFTAKDVTLVVEFIGGSRKTIHLQQEVACK